MAVEITVTGGSADSNVFNISKFRSHINDKGILRNNKFVMNIGIPEGFRKGVENYSILSQTQKYISLRGESSNLPGFAIGTNTFRQFGYGMNEKKPFDGIVNDLNVSFIGDKNGDLWRYFYLWMKMIYNNDLTSGVYPESSPNGILPKQKPYELAYRNEYTTFGTIDVYDEQGKRKMSIDLNRLYPIVLGDVSLNWSDTNNFMRIPVTFAFKDFVENYGAAFTNPDYIDNPDPDSFGDTNKHREINAGPGNYLEIIKNIFSSFNFNTE